MLKKILDMLAGTTESETPSPENKTALATCVLLLEVAEADEEFSDEERWRIQQLLQQRFGLSESEVAELIRESQEHRAESHDLWRFTNQINQSCSRQEKMQLIEEVWRVVYADGTLEAHEDYLAHKLGRLLNLDHTELIEAKMKVRRPS